MFNYAQSAATAKRLLSKFGRKIQHQRVNEGAYDPSTGTVTSTTISTNVLAADFAMKGNEYADASLIQMGDRYALVSPEVTIDVTDKLMIDGVTWNILNVQKLAPSGTAVLWKCHIRK